MHANHAAHPTVQVIWGSNLRNCCFLGSNKNHKSACKPTSFLVQLIWGSKWGNGCITTCSYMCKYYSTETQCIDSMRSIWSFNDASEQVENLTECCNMCSRLILFIMSLFGMLLTSLDLFTLLLCIYDLFPISLCTGLVNFGLLFVIFTTYQTQFSDHYQAILQHAQKKKSIGNYMYTQHTQLHFLEW